MLTSALSFVSEGDVGTAERLLRCFPPLKPLLLAMSWDAPATPAWDGAAGPGVALGARRALVRALWRAEEGRAHDTPDGCCVSGMCRQMAYRLEVAQLVEEWLQVATPRLRCQCFSGPSSSSHNSRTRDQRLARASL